MRTIPHSAIHVSLYTVNISKAAQSPWAKYNIAHGCTVQCCICCCLMEKASHEHISLVPTTGEADCILGSTTRASSSVPSTACMVYEQYVCVFDFLPYRAGLSLHITSLPSLTFTKEATLLKPLPSKQRLHTLHSLLLHLRQIEQLPCDGTKKEVLTVNNVTIVNVLYQRKWVGVVVGLEAEMAAIHVFSLRQLVKMRPSAGVRRVDVLL